MCWTARWCRALRGGAHLNAALQPGRRFWSAASIARSRSFEWSGWWSIVMHSSCWYCWCSWWYPFVCWIGGIVVIFDQYCVTQQKQLPQHALTSRRNPSHLRIVVTPSHDDQIFDASTHEQFSTVKKPWATGCRDIMTHVCMYTCTLENFFVKTNGLDADTISQSPQQITNTTSLLVESHSSATLHASTFSPTSLLEWTPHTEIASAQVRVLLVCWRLSR